MRYEPAPIDTAAVTLGDSILELTERLARNAHDIWARRRFMENWKYGPRRDDSRKEHPCLVDYDELPESEKQYDRNAAIETLKAIIALGYRIEWAEAPESAPGAGSEAPRRRAAHEST